MGADPGVPGGVRPPLLPIAPAFDGRMLALLHAALPPRSRQRAVIASLNGAIRRSFEAALI
jgi:hypothetical protein